MTRIGGRASGRNKNKCKDTNGDFQKPPKRKKKFVTPARPSGSSLEDEGNYSDTIIDDDVFEEPIEKDIKENVQADVAKPKNKNDDSSSSLQSSSSLSSQQLPSSTLEFEVEELLEKKVYYSDVQYKVKWAGYSVEQATWETIENLAGAVEKLYEFEEGKAKKMIKRNSDRNQTLTTKKIIAQERMKLIQSATQVKKVLAIYPKAEDVAEQTVVEFTNGLVLMVNDYLNFIILKQILKHYFLKD